MWFKYAIKITLPDGCVHNEIGRIWGTSTFAAVKEIHKTLPFKIRIVHLRSVK